MIEEESLCRLDVEFVVVVSDWCFLKLGYTDKFPDALKAKVKPLDDYSVA